MAIQTVKVGAAVNDGTGDPSRTCFTKINQNFTDTTHAASRLVGTATGNVVEVGAFGLGGSAPGATGLNTLNASGFYNTPSTWDNSVHTGTVGANQGVAINMSNTFRYNVQIWNPIQSIAPHIRIKNNDVWGNWVAFLTKANTQTDTNGFIKSASPIIKLFADKIECNDEANLQPVTFEKLGVGNYLVKGSTGFAQDGWYVEMPKDANGNALVAVFYKQLANNDISVKTYAKMFDEETGNIVANTAKPRDIPTARWIDLRLQALPQDDTQPLDTDETVATNAE